MTRNSVTIVWLVLVLATAASWWLGGRASAGPDRLAGIAVLVVAFVKVRLIVRHFMEVQQAPPPLQLGLDVWIVVVCVALLVLYLQAPG
jgi:hypothetical protein